MLCQTELWRKNRSLDVHVVDLIAISIGIFQICNDRNSLPQSSGPNKTIICNYWNLLVYSCKISTLLIVLESIKEMYQNFLLPSTNFSKYLIKYLEKQTRWFMIFCFEKFITFSMSILSIFLFDKMVNLTRKIMFPPWRQIDIWNEWNFYIIYLNVIFHEIYENISTNLWK